MENPQKLEQNPEVIRTNVLIKENLQSQMLLEINNENLQWLMCFSTRAPTEATLLKSEVKVLFFHGSRGSSMRTIPDFRFRKNF